MDLDNLMDSGSEERLKDFEIENGVLIRYKGLDNEVVIPDEVTTIGEHAFMAGGVTSVKMGDSVTEIRKSGLSNTSLKHIELGNNVETIGDLAFNFCPIESIVIPDSVTHLGGYAFNSCRELKSVVLGNGITELFEATFLFCDVLTDVTLGNSLTVIHTGAFSQCPSLTSITIPNSVEVIERMAFENCRKLETVIMSPRAQVSAITNFGFYGTRFDGSAQEMEENERQEALKAERFKSKRCYIFFMVFFALKDAKTDDTVKFHANQGLLLFIIEAIALAIYGVLSSISSLVAFLVQAALLAFAIVFSIKGIKDINREEKHEIPLVGRIRLLK